MNRLNKNGFTLVELLVVVAIIGILVTIAIVAINPVLLINDARDSTRRSDLQQIKAAMQLYYNDCRHYPLKTEFDSNMSGGLWDGSDDDAATTCSPTATVYMREVPEPPSGDPYGYVAYTTLAGTTVCASPATNCQSYTLGASLDSPPKPDDNATLTKCLPAGGIDTDPGAGTVAAEVEVCND